jgi:ketosteroid isomerase-like protein
MTPKLIADTYIETWNARDPEERARLLARGWTPTATYVDPLMQGSGAEQIEALITAVSERFPAFRFQLRGTPDGHGAFVRLGWSLGEPGQEASIEGSDVLEMQDGRISRVVGFIDRAPAS